MLNTHQTKLWTMLAQYISFQHMDLFLLLTGIMLNSTRHPKYKSNKSDMPTSWESIYKIVCKHLPRSSSEHMALFQEILIAFFKYNCAKQLHQ